MPDITAIQTFLAKSSTQEAFSGVVRLQTGSTLLYEQAFGLAHRPWNILNTPLTRFRIASISKMFTAAAVLQLIAAGKLNMETRVAYFLGLEAGSIPEEVNLYHLLTMTAGIADWFDESGDWRANWDALLRAHPIYLFRQDADYLPLFLHQPPLSAVGGEHRYSGSSYILLGLVIAKASGQNYFDYIRQHIFKPLGMRDTDFIPLDAVDPQVAEGYIPPEGDQHWKKNIFSVTPHAAADGGAVSTAVDLVRFSQALRASAAGEDLTLLPQHLARAMLTPQVPQFDHLLRGYYWHYGYGVIFTLDPHRRIIRWGHTGEEEGVSCRLYYYPDFDLDVVILGNQSGCAGTSGWEIHDRILNPEIRD